MDSTGDDDSERALGELRRLHAEIDAEAAAVARPLGARITCHAGCSGCCVDDVTVFALEAERIRRAHPELLQNGSPAARGGCAFLDDAGRCRVYADRPYVCRTQGLPLRWFDETDDGELHEHREICELNLEGPLLTTLPDEHVWTIGPYELRLIDLAERFAGGPDPERIALRSLFERPGGTAKD